MVAIFNATALASGYSHLWVILWATLLGTMDMKIHKAQPLHGGDFVWQERWAYVIRAQMHVSCTDCCGSKRQVQGRVREEEMRPSEGGVCRQLGWGWGEQ